MPVVVLQPSGRTTLHASSQGPNSHLCLSLFVMLCINPPFGIIAVVFSIASRSSANMDWDGARRKGKIALFMSIAGIVITGVAGLAVILIFYTRDTSNDSR